MLRIREALLAAIVEICSNARSTHVYRCTPWLFPSRLYAPHCGSLRQQSSPPTEPASGMIYLDVVVTPKSGQPVSGLQQQDFTVLDNNVPQTITSFQALRGREAPIEVVVVIDDVNTGLEHVAYERSEIDKFLRTDGGRLAHPTTLAFLTDSGIKAQGDFSSDGNALSAALDQSTVGLHSILRSGGIYSAVERFQVSLEPYFSLRPTRLPAQAQVHCLDFSRLAAALWTRRRGTDGHKARAADLQQCGESVNSAAARPHPLYSIDPLGSAELGGRAFQWEAFVKGISKPSQAYWGM